MSAGIDVRLAQGALRRGLDLNQSAASLKLDGDFRNVQFKGDLPEQPGRACNVGSEAACNMAFLPTSSLIRASNRPRHELAGLQRHVRQIAKDDAVCRLLMTMPGSSRRLDFPICCR